MRKTLLACLMLTTPAVADESWTTEFGTAFWDIDAQGQAVFSAPISPSQTLRIYLPDLLTAAQRAAHWGYWIQPEGDVLCESTMTGADGVASAAWGRVLLTFDHVDFPSSWTAVLGDCFAEPDKILRAVAQ